jgi:FtsH-binding integral membrane protein
VILALFTASTSIVVARISFIFRGGVVIQAVSLTAAAVLGITISAFTWFKDVDGVRVVSFVAPALSAIAAIFALALFFFVAPNENLDVTDDQPNTMLLFYSALGVSLFALAMLFDTHMIIGGESTLFILGPECIILGAVQLYLEVVSLFVLMLVILGNACK